jgi:hypothetical protein
MNGAQVFLPYYCPTLKSDYFKPPCEGQVAAAKARRDKRPGAVMPYGLEQCLKCGGGGLVTRVAKTISEPANEDTKIIMAPGCEKEVQNIPEIFPSPPLCPRHPAEPQIACGPDSKRAGQYLGACKVCMAERHTGRKPKDKMTPAVARDLGLRITDGTNVILAWTDKHAELKEWLLAQAEENERSLAQEIMYRLKLAMRVVGAGVLPARAARKDVHDQI